MRAGDKIYCIKSAIRIFNEKMCITHKKGKIYIIDEVKYDCAYIYTEFNSTPNGYLGFYTSNPAKFYDFNYFNDYFIDIKHSRKLKMSKLNEKILENPPK